MDPTVKHWVALWDYLDGNLWMVERWAEQTLTPEEVGWQPTPGVASVGWNLEHLAEMLDYYLAKVFNVRLQAKPGALVTMQWGSRDDGRFRDLGPIADYHRKVRPAYREFLAAMTAADLDQVLLAGGRTAAWAVGHIAEHESYHLGKITLLRTLLAERRRDST
jgi:hypothetical protein